MVALARGDVAATVTGEADRFTLALEGHLSLARFARQRRLDRHIATAGKDADARVGTQSDRVAERGDVSRRHEGTDVDGADRLQFGGRPGREHGRARYKPAAPIRFETI